MLEQIFESSMVDCIRKANEFAQNRKMKISHFQFEKVGEWYRLVVLYEKN
jgi:hypothetical protein